MTIDITEKKTRRMSMIQNIKVPIQGSSLITTPRSGENPCVTNEIFVTLIE